MYYIIGSGPAGVSCALGLLENGCDVTLIDAGNNLEFDRQFLIEEMATLEPEEWPTSLKRDQRQHQTARLSGVDLKLAYGSSYPYDIPKNWEKKPITITKDSGLLPSYCKGGFSSVWGASILPYTAADTKEWPFPISELSPHYKAILDWISFSACKDALEDKFPLFSTNYKNIGLSRQAENIYTQMGKNRAALQEAGIFFGQSRLALQQFEQNCRNCGSCMHGCPYGIIYSSMSSIKNLLKRFSNFDYCPGWIVETLKESGNKVTINFANAGPSVPSSVQASKVFIAAGVIPTAHLILQSLGLENHTIKILDSQYFLMPILQKARYKNISNDRLNTLSQIFIEIFDSEISQNGIHLQLYSYNDLYWHPFSKFGALSPLICSFAKPWVERLNVIQGYLHSSDSGYLNLTLKKDSCSKQYFYLEGIQNKKSKIFIKKIQIKLKREEKKFGFSPMTPSKILTSIGLPGRGFHAGGSFPMSNDPKLLECGRDGRLNGFRNVHLVDASILPSIPSTTITLSVMANAHRIATEVAHS